MTAWKKYIHTITLPSVKLGRMHDGWSLPDG